MEIFDYYIHSDELIPAEYEVTSEELYEYYNELFNFYIGEELIQNGALETTH